MRAFVSGSLFSFLFLFCSAAHAEGIDDILNILEAHPEALDELSLEDQFELMDMIDDALRNGDFHDQDTKDDKKKTHAFFDLLTSKGKKKKCIKWEMTIKRKYDGVDQGDKSVDIDDPSADKTKWDVDGPWFTDGDVTLTDNGDGSMKIDFSLAGEEIDINISAPDAETGKSETSASGEIPAAGSGDPFTSEGTGEENSDGSISFDLEGEVTVSGKKKKLELDITLECKKWK